MNSTQVYQFKVELKIVNPTIWRRILVPAEYTFWDLHVAIQDVMGWKDYHLHEFRIEDPRTGFLFKLGIPDDEILDDPHVLSSWEVSLVELFSATNALAVYIYDYGDWWEHAVTFEKVFAGQAEVDYPTCVGGARACPPEDSGGPMGYELFLEALADPEHEAHQQYEEWIGGEFDPEQFDPKKIKFDDPSVRWNIAFGDS
ncbi:MAG: plasmid pRiA4b ORF-3 family protein [Anaerolineales bacterium]|nr:plasmid pRiA4b ORF-3 family protein [Anaerolineales bacterium]